TFNTSSITQISNSADANASGITFSSGASAYTIMATPGHVLNFTTNGIVNQSGTTQHFISWPSKEGSPAVIYFSAAAVAGTQVEYTSLAPDTAQGMGGIVEFIDSSSAANGTYINQGSSVASVGGGQTLFFFDSRADHGTFTNQAA